MQKYLRAFLVCGLAMAASPALPQLPPEVRVDGGNWEPVYPPSLAPYNLSVARDDSRGKTYFYLPPFFQLDRAALATSFQQRCRLQLGTAVVNMPLTFRVSSRQVRNEIEEILRRSYPTLNLPSGPYLRPYPYQFIEISTGLRSVATASSHRVIGRYPLGVPSTGGGEISVAASVTFDDAPITVLLQESCKSISDILDGSAYLRADMYSQVRRSGQNEMSIAYGRMLSSQAIQNLFSDTERTGQVIVQTSSRSKSRGIRIPGFDGRSSSSGSTTSTQDTRRVYVSESVFRELVSDEVESIQWRDFFSAEQSDTLNERRAAVAETLLNALIERLGVVDLAFKEVQSGVFEISDGRVSANLTKEQLQETLQSDLEQQSTFSDSRSAEVSGAGKSSESSKSSLSGKSGIRWERKGGEWIPVSATLLSLARSDLALNRSISLTTTVLDAEPTSQVSRLPSFDGAVLSQFEEFFSPPPKNVIRVDPGYAATQVYDGNNPQPTTYYCEGTLRAGYQFVMNGQPDRIYASRSPDAEDRKRSKACVPPNIELDGSRQHWVTYYRNEGHCMVSQAWWEWYLSRIERIGGAVFPAVACSEDAVTRPQF